MNDSVYTFIYLFNWVIFFYFLLGNGSYLVFTLIAAVQLRRQHLTQRDVRLRKIFETSFFHPVSVVIPARDEEDRIVQSVHAALLLEYPDYDVVVVNDGSTDGTLERLREEFRLVPTPWAERPGPETAEVRAVYVSPGAPNLMVVDKENGGKADALNAGLKLAKHPLVCTIDADSFLERDCLLKIMRAFLEDDRTVAAGGTVRIAKREDVERRGEGEVDLPDGHLARFQVIEYLRAFLYGRVGLSAIRCLLVTSGAFSVMRREPLLESGGFRTDTVGEDMEVICRLHRMMRQSKTPYRITYVPDPVCWTIVPETFRGLAQQRNRWQRGLLESLFMNKSILLNPRYGRIGLFATPYYLLFEALGPLIEIVGYAVVLLSWYLGIVDWNFALLFFVAAFFLGSTVSIAAICLEEVGFRRYPQWGHVIRLLGYALLEPIFFRPLTMLFRIRGYIDFLAGAGHWNDPKKEPRDGSRRSLGQKATAA